MRCEVRLQEVVERFASHGLFEKAKEEVAFVVRNGCHAIVRVAVLQVKAKVGVVGVDVHDGIHLVDQALIAQGAEHFTDVSAVDGLHDALLKVHGEAFV